MVYLHSLGLLVATAALAADPSGAHVPETVSVKAHRPTFAAGILASAGPASLEAMAHQDPFGFLELARARAGQLRDFRCVFRRQERIKGKLKAPCELEVAFLADPMSVYMRVLGEPQSVKRLLYVQGARRGAGGREQMLVEPAGWQRAFVSQTEIAIDDKRVLENCRKTIDNFGFVAILEEFQRVNGSAREAGALDLRYEGKNMVDGRQTFVFKRRLPGNTCGQADGARTTVVQLDSEWLLPVSVKSYKDEHGRVLLGSYEMKRVELDTGLTMSDFTF